MTSFVVYDVFTDCAFGGNKFAVIPDATSLKEDQLQKIARELNFSETTIVYPPVDSENTTKVRFPPRLWKCPLQVIP
ncbi:PhzF family phenazine biosynthesis protein [Cognatiyoonia sp.]|uniref:PhzF family phenazine biosynthesis protein n=1 Tax=Cognatiyoonia sp. TaxID=2211652 RepID=UPI003F69CD53